MGTTAKLFVLSHDGSYCVLFRNVDGYPEHVVAELRKFLQSMEKKYSEHAHMLLDPTLIAAELVRFSLIGGGDVGPTRPAWRPMFREGEDLVDYTYVVTIKRANDGNIVFEIEVYGADVKLALLRLGEVERPRSSEVYTVRGAVVKTPIVQP